MKNKLMGALWGDLKGEEFKKFAFLALGMFFIIGSFWPIKILKDSVFINMIGPTFIPRAKLLSLCLFFILVVAYSRIVSYISREKIIYMLVGVFASLGMIFSYFLSHKTIGVANTTMDPLRIIAWTFYLYVESYAGILVALYWSFINDITTPESAKRGYGMIIFGSQAGGLIAMFVSSYVVSDTSRYVFITPWIIRISMILLILMAVVIYFFHKIVPKKEFKGYLVKKEIQEDSLPTSVGFFEGLKILFSRPYVAGIFSIIFFYEIIATMMQFHMHVLAKSTYIYPALVMRFLFNFGLTVQLTACIFSLLGTSYFQRIFGIRFCLVLYPILLGIFICGYMIYPTIFFITAVMITAKSMNYALNVPAKEVLYIPTSKNIRYKSKAWIDVFGARFAKGTGSFVNEIIGSLVYVTGGIALVLISFWAVFANIIGKKFTRITNDNQKIE